MRRFVETGIFIIIFAGAFAYFANPVAFELRMYDLQNSMGDKISTAQTFLADTSCPEGLEEDVEQNMGDIVGDSLDYDELVGSSLGMGQLHIHSTDLENWTQSDGTYSCNQGDTEGEVSDHLYCNPRYDDAAKYNYEETDEDGTIIETREIELKEIELTENLEVQSIRCE